MEMSGDNPDLPLRMIGAQFAQLDLTAGSSSADPPHLPVDPPTTTDDRPTPKTPSSPARFDPLDYARFDAPPSPLAFSIVTSFPSPTLEHVPFHTPSPKRNGIDDASWPWNWDDSPTNAATSPYHSSLPSPYHSPHRDVPNSPLAFREKWKEKLEPIPEGSSDPFTSQSSTLRESISLTGASIAERRGSGAHASGPGHGAKNGGMEGLFDDMIRFVETKRRYDLPKSSSSGQDWSDHAASRSSTPSDAGDPIPSTLDARGQSRSTSPSDSISVEDDTICIAPLSEITPSPLLSRSESYHCPERPKLRTNNTWPNYEPPRSSPLPSPSRDRDDDTDIFGDTLSTLHSDAGSGYNRVLHTPHHQLVRGESTTTASGGNSVDGCGHGVGPVIVAVDVDTTSVPSSEPRAAKVFSREPDMFGTLDVPDMIPMNRSLSSPAVSTCATTGSSSKAKPTHRPFTHGSTFIAASSPLHPTKASRLRRWREQSFGHFWTRDPDQDTPPARTSTKTGTTKPWPPENTKMGGSGRRSEGEASRVPERRYRSGAGEMPLDMVAASLGSFTWNDQSHSLLPLQAGESDFRKAHEQNIMLEGNQRRKMARKSASPKRHNDWGDRVDVKPSGMVVVPDLMYTSDPLMDHDKSKSAQMTTTLSNISLAASDHTLVDTSSTSPSTAVTPSTSGSSSLANSLTAGGTQAPSSDGTRSRSKSVFGGVPIPEESYRKSVHYAKQLGKRRQERRTVGEAQHFLR